MAGARTVTDEELLGDEDAGAIESLDTLDANDDGAEDTFGATPVAAAVEDPGDSVEFQIVDDDESGKAGEDDDAGGKAAAGVDGDDFDTGDAGEEVGDDFLTADEKKNYSATMQKRIMRERRLKAESDATAQRESAARIAAEDQLLAANVELLNQRKITAGVLLTSLDGQIAAKTAELTAAKDGSDTALEVKVQGELDDLRAQRRDIDAAKRTLDATPVPEKKAAAAPAANPVAERWKARNPWMQNREFAADINQAFFFDRQIAAEGKLDKNTPAYFAELDRRLNQDRPGLRAKVQRMYGSAAARPKPAAVAPVSRSTSTVRAAAAGKPGKVVLTRADLENMTAFGLKTDRTTPEGRRDMLAYAQEKRRNGQNQ